MLLGVVDRDTDHLSTPLGSFGGAHGYRCSTTFDGVVVKALVSGVVIGSADVVPTCNQLPGRGTCLPLGSSPSFSATFTVQPPCFFSTVNVVATQSASGTVSNMQSVSNDRGCLT